VTAVAVTGERKIGGWGGKRKSSREQVKKKSKSCCPDRKIKNFASE